jgi:hypothetical protein
MSVGEGSNRDPGTYFTIAIPGQNTNYVIERTEGGFREYLVCFSGEEGPKTIHGVGMNKKEAISFIKRYRRSQLPWHRTGDINTGEANLTGHEVSLEFDDIRGKPDRYMGPGIYLAEMAKFKKRGEQKDEEETFHDACRAHSYADAELLLIEKHGARYRFRKNQIQHDVLIQRAEPIHVVHLGPVLPGTFPIHGRDEESAVMNFVGEKFDEFIKSYAYHELLLEGEEGSGDGRKSYIQETVKCILEGWSNEKGPVKIFPGVQLKLSKDI